MKSMNIALLSTLVVQSKRNLTKNEDDENIPYHEDPRIASVSLATAIVAPVTVVIGLAGVTMGLGFPIEWPPERWWCARRFPCHWEPLTLFRACVCTALVSLGLAATSLVLPVRFAVLGSTINGACFLLAVIAAKYLYLPRYRLRHLLRQSTHG